MAKDRDHLAGGFEADNTGGVLSGLLADEDVLDRRALWRIGSWGVGAVGAVILAVVTNQSSLGLKRDQMAAVELTRQAQQIQLAARDTQNETRRLASAIDTLNGDRDRLYTRVTSLEQGLDSVTGSIVRQNSAGAMAPPSPFSTADLQPGQNPPPAPIVAPVASMPTSAPEKLAMISTGAKDLAKSELAKPEPAKPEAAKTEAAKVEAKADVAKTEIARPELPKIETVTVAKADLKPEVVKPDSARTPAAAPFVAAKSMMAPPDPAAAKLIEPNKPVNLNPVTASPIPEVIAALPTATDEEADEATAPKVALQKTEFGVDLGSANSVNGLRAMWRGLLKSRSNAPLAALRPIIVIKEAPNGSGMQLRLVAGPLSDAGAAARICAVLTENNRNCETTVFDGQRLSLRSDDPATPPAATAKPGSRKHSATKRAAAAVVEEPAKKPESPSLSSSISSMFGRKSTP